MELLLRRAWEVRELAYAPYSHFAVGAALEDDQGRVFVGCNVENVSFGLTICAERAALCSALASGSRRFKRIAIVSDSAEPVSPCGACRQVLAEFAPDLPVITENRAGDRFESTLALLLPRGRTGIMDKGSCST
jgi:cytidine deaminase